MAAKPDHMKIGIVCYPTVGGSGALASELGIWLASRGHEIHFISSEVPFRLKEQYQHNIFNHTVSLQHYDLFKYPPYTMALAAKISEVMRWHQLDLVHVHYAIPHAVSAFLARGNGRRSGENRDDLTWNRCHHDWQRPQLSRFNGHGGAAQLCCDGSFSQFTARGERKPWRGKRHSGDSQLCRSKAFSSRYSLQSLSSQREKMVKKSSFMSATFANSNASTTPCECLNAFRIKFPLGYF